MKRKIIQIAGSTYLVSLPKKWCIEQNIKKGEEIDVIECGNEITITTEKKILPSSCEIDITGLDRTSIFYSLRALYKKGYDEIKIKYNNPVTTYIRKKIDLNIISVIYDEVTRLTGVEIIEQKENYCILKVISDVSSSDVSIIIKRIFGLMNEGYNDLIEGSKTNNIIQLLAVKQKHDIIMRFISHSKRTLNKNKLINKDNYYLMQILTQMDNITTLLHISARFFRKYKKKIKKTTEEILKLIHNNFESYLELYSKFDIKKIKEMNINKECIDQKIAEKEKKIPFEELNVLITMQNSLKLLRPLTETIVAKHF